MKKRQRVMLYGDTVVLDGVRLSLEANPSFEVIPLDASQAAGQDLLALNPDAIIFDIGSVQPQFHYDLILQRSGLQLIGIDPDRDQVLLWSGQQLRELSVQDLFEVIHKEGHQEHKGIIQKNL